MPARSKLRIRRRISPGAAVWPALRWLISAGLVLSLGIGGIRYLSLSRPAGALSFTSHIIGVETGAVGVLGMAASDIDDDGDIDIVTAGSDGIKVYINNNDGSFTVKLVDDVKGERAQVIDLDKDGAQDILVTVRSTTPSVRWYRNTGGIEFSGTSIGTGYEAKAYAGDIDADGAPDIVTATTDGERVTLQRWMNNGTGTFTATTMGTGTGVTAVTVADVDGNGYADIVTGGSAGLQRWDTADGYNWSRVDVDDSNTGQTHLVVKDVNKDGRADIVVAEPAGNMLLLYRNLDSTAFDRIEVGTGVDAVTVVPVDLDEDGDEDIVVAAQDDNSIFWYNNDGSEEFTKTTIASSLQSVFGVVVTDVDNDNDFDVIAGDHHQGIVYWYERVLAKPVATAPGEITQGVDGSGKVTFTTKVNDDDRDKTRLRVQYTVDGVNWYKPWLTAVSADTGSADLKNSNGYQVGTANRIDTDVNDNVKLTLVWDTRSVLNTGGPILGEVATARLRVIPRDDVGNGETAASSAFQIDNEPPQLANVQAAAVSTDQVELTWDEVKDSSLFDFALYYGTNHAAVLEKTAATWDETDDAAMGDTGTRGTTVTGLAEDTQYYFKLFVTDAFGNTAGVSSVRATTGRGEGVPTPSGAESPAPTEGEAAPIEEEPPAVSATPSSLPSEPASPKDLPPVAQAGADQIVNPGAVVILDGTNSYDPEGGALTYAWRQLKGAEVELDLAGTATPSFTAVGESEVYVFNLSVRDFSGQAAADMVTIVTRALPEAVTGAPVEPEEEPGKRRVSEVPAVVSLLLRPLNIMFFLLSLAATVVSLLDLAVHAGGRKRVEKLASLWRGRRGPVHRGRIVQYKTGEPIVGANILVYGEDGKIKHKLHTNAKGAFAVSLAPGDYTLAVEAEGFAFSPAAATFNREEGDVLYMGGILNITDRAKALNVIIPMKPTGEAVSSMRTRVLRVWQVVQRNGHVLSWPLFIGGSLLNTALLLWVPESLFLLLEMFYVGLVAVKIVLEVRLRPSYGFVRDAITHVPLDLAVVRLYELGTNRLVMTRVADNQGRFFALPSPGRYTVTVAKPGYASFSRENIEITAAHDAKLQMKVDLMPVAPPVSLAPAVV